MTLEEMDVVIADLLARVEHLEQLQGIKPRAVDDNFEIFWRLYPRRVGRVDAARAWAKLSNADQGNALAGAEAYAKIWALAHQERHQFIKYPASWLRARSWEDGEVEWRRVAGTNGCGSRILIGSHAPTPGTHHPVDLQLAPPDIQDIARRWKTKEDTTEEEDARYLAWEQAIRGKR